MRLWGGFWWGISICWTGNGLWMGNEFRVDGGLWKMYRKSGSDRVINREPRLAYIKFCFSLSLNNTCDRALLPQQTSWWDKIGLGSGWSSNVGRCDNFRLPSIACVNQKRTWTLRRDATSWHHFRYSAGSIFPPRPRSLCQKLVLHLLVVLTATPTNTSKAVFP